MSNYPAVKNERIAKRKCSYSETLTLQKLIDDGYYAWDGMMGTDAQGRHYLRRTSKGATAMMYWPVEKLRAVTTLLNAAGEV